MPKRSIGQYFTPEERATMLAYDWQQTYQGLRAKDPYTGVWKMCPIGSVITTTDLGYYTGMPGASTVVEWLHDKQRVPAEKSSDEVEFDIQAFMLAMDNCGASVDTLREWLSV